MEIDRPLLNKLAHLSRLELDEKDIESTLADLNNIITWVEKLQEVNTDQAEPITSMSLEVNRWREDEPGPHLDHQRALSQAPEKDNDFFKVPKVLE
ncbi:MAG: Asp-tRNA(Asn)/Glu-tRNA(Gln) amidotransferase subunit GatC [Bacteroidetes bacterium]|nr:Asp-tRNA(Asn)/Glu-tRNA(Gln) amidotransferase subunit GatC [Bacteroidota bacterium]